MEENILIGGIKNALKKGENPNNIKKSFLNAGYPEQEVNNAFNLLSQQEREQKEDNNPIQDIPKTNTLQEKAIPLQNQYKKLQTTPELKKTSKWFWIIGISIGVIVIVLALVLGLFWDKFFN